MIVIADDITGAAEIAALAIFDTKVIATNTRSLTIDDAIAETQRVISKYKKEDGAEEWTPRNIFKKTDSALRGHIIAELEILMNEIGAKRCLLLPQNPSKGRVIRNGQYFVGSQLLHKTAFSYDPEFPAHTSNVVDILGKVTYLPIEASLVDGINIAEAGSFDEIKRQLAKIDEKTLIAGGADVFTQLIDNNAPRKASIRCLNEHLIIIQGSTQRHSLVEMDLFKEKDIKLCAMPDEVFDGYYTDDWVMKDGNICLFIPQRRKGHPQWLTEAMALAVEKAVADRIALGEVPLTIIIEGGATAYAVLSKLGWHNYEMIGQLAPGVVILGHDDDNVVLKPGSYPWGEMF